MGYLIAIWLLIFVLIGWGIGFGILGASAYWTFILLTGL